MEKYSHLASVVLASTALLTDYVRPQKQKDGESITYLHSETINVGIGTLSSSKKLIVQLDQNGIVTDYNLSTNGK
jgi:hypothetical protein